MKNRMIGVFFVWMFVSLLGIHWNLPAFSSKPETFTDQEREALHSVGIEDHKYLMHPSFYFMVPDIGWESLPLMPAQLSLLKRSPNQWMWQFRNSETGDILIVTVSKGTGARPEELEAFMKGFEAGAMRGRYATVDPVKIEWSKDGHEGWSHIRFDNGSHIFTRALAIDGTKRNSPYAVLVSVATMDPETAKLILSDIRMKSD